MALPEEDELKRRLRVIAASSDLSQPDLAAAIGAKYSTFKGYFVANKPGPPVGVVLALAEHVGVPREFVLDGWDAMRRSTDLERRIRAIEERNGVSTP